MGGSEFLRRLQPLKADMEAAYFRVYQPFHVREEDFDALLALLDEQAQKRTLNLQRTDRQTPWFKQEPAGMRLVYSDAQTPAQVHARAQELKELGVGWVLFSDVPYPYTESLRQTLRQRIGLWHKEGLAVGVDLDVASTPAEDPWALEAIQGNSAMQQRYWMISDPKLASLFSPFSKEKENGDFLWLEEIQPVSYTHLDVYKRQSRFYVSVQDDLMVRFGSEKMESLFSQLGDVPIESKVVTKSIGSAQKRVEGVNFDVRKTLLEYDDVLRQQREIIYEQRNFILDHDDVHSIVKDMFDRVVSNLVSAHTEHDGKEEHVNTAELLESLGKMGFHESLTETDLEGKSIPEISELCCKAAWDVYESKIEPIKVHVLPIEKTMVLKVIDRNWVDHIDTMSKLRDGIHLRSYAQSNPLQAYVSEGYQLFEDMMARIAQEVVTFCLNVRIVIEERKK